MKIPTLLKNIFLAFLVLYVYIACFWVAPVMILNKLLGVLPYDMLNNVWLPLIGSLNDIWPPLVRVLQLMSYLSCNV